MKTQYKKLTGTEYKPTAAAPAQKENQKPTAGASSEAEQLVEKIAQQGDKVRELKSNKSASKVSSEENEWFFRELASSSDDFERVLHKDLSEA